MITKAKKSDLEKVSIDLEKMQKEKADLSYVDDEFLKF